MRNNFGKIFHFLCSIPQNLHRLVGESRQLHNRPILGLVQSYICVSLTLLGNHLDKIVMAVAMNLRLDLLFLLLLLAIAITNTTLQKFFSKCIANISDKVVALILSVPPRLKGFHIPRYWMNQNCHTNTFFTRYECSYFFTFNSLEKTYWCLVLKTSAQLCPSEVKELIIRPLLMMCFSTAERFSWSWSSRPPLWSSRI